MSVRITDDAKARGYSTDQPVLVLQHSLSALNAEDMRKLLPVMVKLLPAVDIIAAIPTAGPVTSSGLCLDYAVSVMGGAEIVRRMYSAYGYDALGKLPTSTPVLSLIPSPSTSSPTPPQPAQPAPYQYWMVSREGGVAPSKKHLTLEVAAAEADRLAALHPGRKVHVLSVVSSRVAESVQTVEIKPC